MDKHSDGLPRNGNLFSQSADDKGPENLLLSRESTGPGTSKCLSTPVDILSIFGLDNAIKGTRGVKRKFEGNENGTRLRKRRKTFHYKQTERTRGEKRKGDSGHSEQPRKRFKETPPEVEIDPKETERLVSNNTFGDENKNVPNIDNSTSGFDSKTVSIKVPLMAGPSKDISEEELNDTKSEQKDDNYSCPSSCVCNVGFSSIPEPIERYFDTPRPLYRSVLMRRLYRLSNMQYTCCESRCVKRYQRESVMRISLLHMTRDYDESDLHVHRYSWGEWKG